MGKRTPPITAPWLRGEGWTVLRFSNQEVMADTAACAQTAVSTTSRL
ncbi:MAG: DUF559 domain-containing protein, partial [Gammaproteobacteria bacterium]